MALSIFADPSKPPQPEDLAAALGSTYRLWADLQARIALRFPPLTVEWGCSSKQTGWGLRLKREPRTILYMAPCDGFFIASFALGEKAVQAAHASDLPASVLQVIDTAKKYAEGRGVRLEIRTPADLDSIEQLAKIKMAN